MRGTAFAMLALVGCEAGRSAYHCATSDQCVDRGAVGVCEPQGYCSFPDPSCPDGRKFEPNAGDGLAGTCVMVDAGVPDAPTCGELGQACCAGAMACGADTYCASGTCQQCVTAISPGRHSSCVVTHDHAVWCAGANDVGQLGFGLAGDPVASWMQVHDTTGLAIADATTIASGFEFACAARANGTVWCWGGLGGPSASQIDLASGGPLTGIVELGGGYSHACGRDATGGVWCWGQNPSGQLGDNTTTNRQVAAPVLAAAGALGGAVALAVGGDHACIRKANDELWCWGRNASGELGDGSTTNRLVAVKIGAGRSVGTGWHNTCSVHADNTVWCSGQASRNLLGDGVDFDAGVTPNASSMPVQVVTALGGPPLVGATAVVVGGVACALLLDGTVDCWGSNQHGQTGTGAGAIVPTPVITQSGARLDRIDQLSIRGGARMCAHRASGEWLCWGRGLEGEFGDGGFLNHGTATPLRFTCP